jgi:formylglycine-generating enzyme required for sulfatase activity
MSGKVWERCTDTLEIYYNGNIETQDIMEAHPVCGGSCSSEAYECLPSSQFVLPAARGYADVGFRLVLSAAKPN